MSTSLRDFPHAVAVAAAFYPDVQTEDAVGDAVDLADADGPCFAIQMVGDLSTGTSVAGEIQQSADDDSWSAISGGAFTTVTVSGNLQKIQFTPTMRYVRWIATIAAGMSPSAAVAVVVGRQKKTF